MPTSEATDILTRSEGAQRLSAWGSAPVEQGFIYLIQGEVRTPIKVGHAHNVSRRLRELQTGNHAELHVLDVLPGDLRAEAQLHGLLAPYRIRGEWFRWDDAVAAWLMLRAVAEQSLTFYLATGRITRFETFDPWHAFVRAVTPEPETVPQSLPGERLDLVPTHGDRASRTRLTPSAAYNLQR